MTMPTTQRWCHACSKFEDFGSGWYALYIAAPDGECVITRTAERDWWLRGGGEIFFACGQTPALVLVERYLHTGTFNPPAPAEPSAPPAPDQFEALT